ncbi:MAG: hypothetical protein ACRDUV_19550 [Pseudonocardiaceae bacterium]
MSPRRRSEVSLSSPEASSGPVEQLDRAVEILHGVSRALPETVLSPEELIALGGLLTQISGALLTLTELLIAPVHHYDRTRVPDENTDIKTPTAATLLRDCRNSYIDASAAARAFHADIKRRRGNHRMQV